MVLGRGGAGGAGVMGVAAVPGRIPGRIPVHSRVFDRCFGRLMGYTADHFPSRPGMAVACWFYFIISIYGIFIYGFPLGVLWY